MLKEGIFILEYANKRNLKAILRYLFKKQAWNPFSQEPVEFTELNFDFHPKAVRRYLEEAGFLIEKQLTVSHFRIGFLKKLLPTGLLVRLDSGIQWTGRWLQFSPSVFTRNCVAHPNETIPDGVLFQCPLCHTHLPESRQDMVCPQCGAVWPYRDGIYDFRLSENGTLA